MQGTRFKWVTDHRGLVYLLQQKNLSGQQARWIEKISPFDFEINYIPSSENVVADSLSRLYSNDSKGTVRSPSEYTYHDIVNEDNVPIQYNTQQQLDITPILAGIEAKITTKK